MKKLIIAIATTAMLSACGATGPTKTLEEANAAIVEANAANGKAKKVHYEWRDTGKLIKKARKAKGQGDYDGAVKLANKAKRQAMNAYAQYEANKNAGPRY